MFAYPELLMLGRFANVILFVFLLFPGLAFSQSQLVPFAKGNKWVLKSFLRKDLLTVTIDDVKLLGPKEIAILRISHVSLGDYASIVSINENGLYLEGYIEKGITHMFPAASPYFLSSVATGTKWTNPYGTFELTDKALRTVSATGKVYENCLRYVLTQADGTKFIWVLKPGVGFVRFSEGPAAFTLRSFNDVEETGATSVKTQVNCPLVGLSAIPRGDLITTEIRENALLGSLDVKVGMLKVEASWDELEPAPLTYNFDRLKDELNLARKYDLPVVLTIKTVDTTLKSIPADLLDQELDGEKVLTRFDALLTAVGEILPPQVKWINLGYELDFYLLFHPNDIRPFVTLFLYGSQKLKTMGNYSVGLVFQYDNTRISDVVFKALFQLGDHVCVNYYGHTEGFRMRDPDVPLVDIPFLVDAAKDKPLLITELGYASSPVVEGSPERQAQFLRRSFEAIAASASKIHVVNVWAIRDLPQSFIRVLEQRHNITDQKFVAFLGSLGLQNEDGDPKPAWDVFREFAVEFKEGRVCFQQ